MRIKGSIEVFIGVDLIFYGIWFKEFIPSSLDTDTVLKLKNEVFGFHDSLRSLLHPLRDFSALQYAMDGFYKFVKSRKCRIIKLQVPIHNDNKRLIVTICNNNIRCYKQTKKNNKKKVVEENYFAHFFFYKSESAQKNAVLGCLFMALFVDIFQRVNEKLFKQSHHYISIKHFYYTFILWTTFIFYVNISE